MRFFLPSLPTRLGLIAAATLLALPDTARAQATVPAYAFAQQKVYGMTITGDKGAKAFITAKPFSVTMQTSATYDTIGTQTFTNGLDPKQAYVSPSATTPVGENWSGNVPANPGSGVFSNPARERVLLQQETTPWGDPQALRLDIPLVSDVTAGDNFARSDAYATPNPDNTVGADSSGVPVSGSGWNNGTAVDPSKLFKDIGTPGTLSIDAVAEVLLTTEPHGTRASSVTNWTVTGAFAIANNPNQHGDTKVTFDFNLVERLVVFSAYTADPGTAASASNTLAFDVKDSLGRSVFGGILGGENPSSTRLISSVSNFSQTYNNASDGSTFVYPGTKNVNFQTNPLKAGNYTFSIEGTTTAKAIAVPEPGALAALASAGVTLGLVVRARRGRTSPSTPA